MYQPAIIRNNVNQPLARYDISECTHNSKYQLGPKACGFCIHGSYIMVIFPSNTSYFSLSGHPTLCVNLSDSSCLDHSLGSTAFDNYSRVYGSVLPVPSTTELTLLGV